MIRSLTTAGTGMIAQQTNLDTIANNLANVNTTAYKQQRAEFQDMMYQTLAAPGAPTGANSSQPVGLQIGLGSMFSASATNFDQGSLQSTGNPYDIGISGEGFFQVQMPDGTTAYTRDGSFKTDANGLLVTSEGYAVEPNITVPAGVTNFTVSPGGIVSVTAPGQNEPQELGQITLAKFVNPAGLQRLGQNLYAQTGASGDPQVVNPGEEGSGQLMGGVLEGSNVQIVEEMVRMILAQRAYEINSKAIQTADDMLQVLNSLKR
ncbi:MAG: flagellar basal-body rod protein FlgG [Fimbriimonadaceae bacterium]|nr:flagellar basal-body rod protein FlgG [Fimbriimonadaceae bacterium]